MSKQVKLAVICSALLMTIWAGQTPVSSFPADLPQGAGVELVREKCVDCHEADLIVQQRMTKPGWVREVDKMMRWGTVLTDAEKATVVDYLAAHFPVKPTPPATTSAPTGASKGESIFEEKCLLCHAADLTQQQRLTRAGWTREVDKMIRWGAEITDAEKAPLIEYLATKYK